MSINEISPFEIISDKGWLSIKKKIEEIESSFLNKGHIDNNDAEKRKELSLLRFLSELNDKFLETKKTLNSLQNEIKSTNDQSFIELFKEEEEIILKDLKNLEKTISEEIFSPDEDAKRSIFLEIRAGTGGLEASLFANELARAYSLYSAKKGWGVSIIDIAETGIGGFKEATLNITGKNVYELFKYEAGVHRVQRVPETEGSGRVHTSTITVAVLPEVEEDVEVNIDPKDIRIDTYRASGAGGQHVNKTDSAVRITHFPSGVVVQCQDERSQHKNKAKAFKMLRSKIFIIEKEKQDKKLSDMRKDMVSSADRSDKIRTYNFPQNRVTDHQVSITINKLDFFMQGELDEILDPLVQKGRMNRKINKFFEPFFKEFGRN